MKAPRALNVLALLLPIPCLAYPHITSPSAGESLPGGTTLKVEWIDNGDSPTIAELQSYQMLLYSGGNQNPAQLLTLVAQGTFTTDTATTVTIPLTLGSEITNAYFIGLTCVAIEGGTYTTYSDRFTLTGMKGTFAAAVSAALLASTVTAGPSPVNNLVADQVAASSSEIAEYTVAYTMQTGTIRYASMPLLPPTAITATNTEPMHATSSASIATAYLEAPTIVTTITQAATYSFESHANTASAAPNPTDDGSDMAKFLRRWKDDEE